MRDDRSGGRPSRLYQTAVLGISALIIVGTWLMLAQLFQTAINRPGGVSVGLEALGQILGWAAPHGPSAEELPGLVSPPTPAVVVATPTLIPTSTPTPIPQATATPTPDVRFYDPNRAKTLLAQAQTSFGNESPSFVLNLTLAAQRLNDRRIAPGATFSFASAVGPYTVQNGYRSVQSIQGGPEGSSIPTIEGGITQLSTTLFQAAFWSGLKIVERHTHPYWLDRFNAGSTGQRGLDAFVSDPTDDLKIANNTGDWIRIEASAQSGSVSVAIYGADPGWSVNPEIGPPRNLVQPSPTQTMRPDPGLPPGQRFTLFPGTAGFEVMVQRTVSLQDQVVDRYGVAERYNPLPAIIMIGPTPTATPAPPTPETTNPGQNPTHLAGLDPTAFVLPDGRIRTPNLVGLTEDEAQRVITAVGLQTTYVNYQGPGDVPAAALNAVPVGHVLSQNPQPGTAVPRGTTVYIAVRKQ